MPYKIQKALTAARWDLIVNGITIAVAGTRREIADIVMDLTIKKLLTVEEV